MTIQLGIIGAGTIGTMHAEAARAVGIPISYVVDRDEDRAAKLAAASHAKAVRDVQEIWDDTSTEAVVIGVPNCLHKQLAIDALQHGKHLLLEKPMAMNQQECAEINRVARETDRHLQIGFLHRYSAVGRAAREFLAAGELGHVYHAKAQLCLRRGVPGLGSWFTTKAISGGGALIDIGVHVLDLALYVLGHPEPISVTGQTYSFFGCRMRDYVYETMWAGPPNYQGVCDVEDSAHALIRFPGGMTLELNVAWAGNFPAEALPESMMGFFGDQGGMAFRLFGDHLLLARQEGGHNVDTKVRLASVTPLQDQIVDFVAGVRTRSNHGATGPQAAVVQSLVDAIYRSSDEGRTVEL